MNALLLLCPLTSLFGFVLGAPSDTHMVFSYRNVPEYKADAYKAAGTLVWFPASAIQLGDVVYMSTGPKDWPMDDWYCVNRARTDTYMKKPRVWIPEYDDCGNELWGDEDAIEDYIKGLGVEPRDSIRMSYVGGVDGIVQLTITEEMLNGNGGDLDIQTWCTNKEEVIDKFLPVPWKTWDIIGRPADI